MMEGRDNTLERRTSESKMSMAEWRRNMQEMREMLQEMKIHIKGLERRVTKAPAEKVAEVSAARVDSMTKVGRENTSGEDHDGKGKRGPTARYQERKETLKWRRKFKQLGAKIRGCH
ncbi:hypothetical protein LR48_Vigan08g067400 [Vigna angularis]|uniref:Uncharacterized protein n=1 Tax=Phaseolus angularis TaxID=3914 RepID=A0A0L9V4G7_PHAAN|nr:hypothetical protein LR48_Vigan08g067400 [Vigna angularis]